MEAYLLICYRGADIQNNYLCCYVIQGTRVRKSILAGSQSHTK